jgi:hypothetical protein
MDFSNIVLEIDATIARLQQARALLSDSVTKRKPGRPAGRPTASAATNFNPEEFPAEPTKRGTRSPATRKRTADAQRLRWANSRKSGKKLADSTAASPAKKTATQQA